MYKWIFHHQEGAEMSFLNFRCKKMLCGNCQVSNCHCRLLTPNFLIVKMIIYEEIHQEETIWPCFSDVMHMKVMTKGLIFPGFMSQIFFHASLTIVRKYTERKVSCWKMTIRINWKMKEGVIVCFGDASNFSKPFKNL